LKYSREDETDGPEALPKRYYVLDLITRLRIITSRLRVLGIVTLVLTLSNIAVLVGLVVASALIKQYNQVNSYAISNGIVSREYLSYWWLVGNLAILIVALVALGASDLLRRRGDAFFQEVSNTFQEIEKEQISNSSELPDELIAEARIGLRSFASSADPPLIRGRFGAGIYALVNIVIVLISVILYAQAT
jgi:hypothetical protein